MLSARRCDTCSAPAGVIQEKRPAKGHSYIIKKCLALTKKVPWPVLPGYVNNNNVDNILKIEMNSLGNHAFKENVVDTIKEKRKTCVLNS